MYKTHEINRPRDKGKQRAIGVQISEQVHVENPLDQGLRLDGDLERARKEKEMWAKELEKVELEDTAIEIRKKIDFLKHTSGPSNVAASFLGQGGNHGNLTTQTNGILGAAKILDGSNTRTSTSQGMDPPHGVPINERYKKLIFFGIPDYPNVFPDEIRKKLPKFTGNNVITCEEHLKIFMDVIDDYNVEPDDVVMKLFVQSLTEDARDWFRGFPHASIGSWNEFKNCFKEHYGDKTNEGFILNEFNNIKKN